MRTTPARHHRLVVAGAVAAGVALAGAATAVAVTSATAATPDAVAATDAPTGEPVPTEQYDAFWGAGYTIGDAEHLAALWDVELREAKARAGQALLDGTTPPIAPGTYPDLVTTSDPAREAFWEAGYTVEDAEALAALWQLDLWDTKARAGQALLDGEPLPVAPSGTAESAS